MINGFRAFLYKVLDRRIRKILKGNRKAQSALYDEYSSLVMGICYRYVKDKDEAADIFQEAFMKIFQNIHQVKKARALGGWIRKVAVNASLDHLKAMRYPDTVGDESHELSDHFYSNLLDKMSMDVILDVVNKLPDGCRIIFNLHILDGFSHKEIAEKLEISESTSRSQLTHARKLLKRNLNELGITRYEQVI